MMDIAHYLIMHPGSMDILQRVYRSNNLFRKRYFLPMRKNEMCSLQIRWESHIMENTIPLLKRKPPEYFLIRLDDAFI